MFKNIRRAAPKCAVVNKHVHGKYVVVVEQLPSGAIPMGSKRKRGASAGVVRMCDIALLSLFTAFRFTETYF